MLTPTNRKVVDLISQVRVHITRFGRDAREEVLTINKVPLDHDSWQEFEVYLGDELLGFLYRDPRWVEAEVHRRIRYDFKPKVGWEARQAGNQSWVRELRRRTRVEALGDLLGEQDIHVAGRKPFWQSCALCDAMTQ